MNTNTAFRRKSRRAAAAVAAVAVLSVPAGLAGPAASAASSNPTGWTSVDLDASHSRYNAGTTALTSSTVSKATKLRDLDTPYKTAASSVISGGKVYVLSDGVVHEFDEKTGVRQWSQSLRDFDQQTFGNLSINGSVLSLPEVYVDEDHDSGSRTYRLDASSGRWLTGHDDQLVADLGATSLYQQYTDCEADCGSDHPDSALRLYNTSTDALIKQIGPDFRGANIPVVIVHASIVYQEPDTKDLVAVSASTGNQIWKRTGTFTLVRADNPTSTGYHLYVRDESTKKVLDLDPVTGKTRFTLTGASTVLAVDATRVYAQCATTLCTFTRSTGAASWKRTGVAAGTAVTVAGDVVYLGDGNVLKASTGTKLTRLWTTATTRFSVGNGYVAADLGKGYAELFGLPGS